MSKIKLFISSVQSEFEAERKALANFLRADALLSKFFEPFLFEELPAIDKSVQQVYLNEVESSQIYLGIIGKKYGYRDSEGVSPTEREYDEASRLHKTRFIFLSTDDSSDREKEVNQFIKKIEKEVVRKSFTELSSLQQGVYHCLIRYLEENMHIQSGPFDAHKQTRAKIEDIDPDKVESFVRLAKSRRGFPLGEKSPVHKVLHHLNLVEGDKITNAALLLFGKKPQRFFPTATVKCAVFHGLTKTKPIHSYKIFDGDVFEMVDLATDFVMSQLNFSVGTRTTSNIAPGRYEIPVEVVREGIVNAVAHRNFASNASVEVILYRDRLEISNPGSLPLGWTTEHLKQLHNSIPHNPLIAHPMYLAGYIEQVGTGIEDMIERLKGYGLPEPEFIQNQEFKVIITRPAPQDTMQDTMQDIMQDTMQVKNEIKELILILSGDMTRTELQERLNLRNRDHFRRMYINAALDEGWIEQTMPDKPTSKYQKYRLTEKGKKAKEQWRK